MLYLYILAPFALMLFYSLKYNTVLQIKENFSYRYNRWRTLRNAVIDNNPNIMFPSYETTKIILKSYQINLIQHFNKSVKKIDKKTYEVTYQINNKTFIKVVKTRKGPTLLDKVVDHENNDITEKILKYIGPNYDWHNSSITPDYFNLDNIKFFLKNGEEITFYRDNVMGCL